jgi:hypothetical protein
MGARNQRPQRSAKDCALSRYSDQWEESGGPLGTKRGIALGTVPPSTCFKTLFRLSESLRSHPLQFGGALSTALSSNINGQQNSFHHSAGMVFRRAGRHESQIIFGG